MRCNDSNPQFNEWTVFKLSAKDLNSALLKISLFEVVDEVECKIGHLIIGPEERAAAHEIGHHVTTMSHWTHMLKQVRKQVRIL